MEHSKFILTKNGDIIDENQLNKNLIDFINKYSMDDINIHLLEIKAIINAKRIKEHDPFSDAALVHLIDRLLHSFSVAML